MTDCLNLHRKAKKRISEEINMLKTLKHPKIIAFINAWTNKEKEQALRRMVQPFFASPVVSDTEAIRIIGHLKRLLHQLSLGISQAVSPVCLRRCRLVLFCKFLASRGVLHHRADHWWFSPTVHQEDQCSAKAEGHQKLVSTDPGRQDIGQQVPCS